MSPFWQSILVIVVVGLAAAYLVVYFVRRKKKKKCCADCPISKLPGTPLDRSKMDGSAHH